MKPKIGSNRSFGIVFLIISLTLSLKSYSQDLKIGEKVIKEIKLSKSLSIPLSEGEWEVVHKYSVTNYFVFKGIALVKLVNNEISEIIIIERVNLSGKKMGYVDGAVNEIVFKDNYDGCYERPEYFIVKLYRKGSTHNCLVVRHVDLKKELYTPDDPSNKGTFGFKNWIEKNNIKYSPIMLGSFHSYFSRLSANQWTVIRFIENPNNFNSPELLNITEDTSEFNKNNIKKYPDHKKTMNTWLSKSAKNHKIFEKIARTKKKHLLNLDDLIDDEPSTNKSSNIVENLKKLQNLYKSGSITKEEFEKAKKLLLN